uniref:Putative echinoderm microtubule-associated n=1 Tax=Lutzomyia longipalpis TaxID=7200 RepID=A0A1B0CH64_LUTLO
MWNLSESIVSAPAQVDAPSEVEPRGGERCQRTSAELRSGDVNANQVRGTMSNEDALDDGARASGVSSLGMNGAHNPPVPQPASINNNASGAVDINGSKAIDVSDDEEFIGGGDSAIATSAPATSYWGSRAISSRAASPAMDNMSEVSSQLPGAPLPRSKSRTDFGGGGSSSSRYADASFWKARRVLFYRNGDPFFPGVEYRFKPGRDVATMEALLDKISPRLDLPRGARFVFSMDGDRKYSLEELEDGASYVVSSFKTFKVDFVQFP